MTVLKIFLAISLTSWAYTRSVYVWLGYPGESYWTFLRRRKPKLHSAFKLVDLIVKGLFITGFIRLIIDVCRQF